LGVVFFSINFDIVCAFIMLPLHSPFDLSGCRQYFFENAFWVASMNS